MQDLNFECDNFLSFFTSTKRFFNGQCKDKIDVVVLIHCDNESNNEEEELFGIVQTLRKFIKDKVIGEIVQVKDEISVVKSEI